MEHWITFSITTLYFVILCLVALYGFHRYVLVYLYVKHRHNLHRPPKIFEESELPYVTVQLPMFNEDMVAERVIAATCRMDYPRDRFEVQVLDDSTDHSAEIAESACREWAAKGINIVYLHRKNRDGFKAGALQEGMKVAKGQFIAIFDADFIPPPDLLRNVINHFSDEKVGMVQVRWDHLNRDASILTKSQAIFLDGHFVIEHTARNRSGRFMHFNGTAGVWRRKTIEEAGGWQHDTLTEDLDLSYRAQLKGWQFVYLPQYVAPAELPPEMVSFKQQAHRWTKGSMQTAIKLLPRILSSKLPWSIKSEAFFHLTCTVVYPLMVLMTLLMYPTFIFNLSPVKINQSPMIPALQPNAEWSGPVMNNWLFGLSLFVLATCSASTFFIYAQKELFGRLAGWKTLFHLPFIMALGVGVCVNNTKAVIEAIISMIRRKPAEFVRTPKYGVTGKHQKVVMRDAPKFNFSKLCLPAIEIAFGIYMLSFIVISIKYSAALTTIPFLMIFAGGYLYVGCSTLWVLYRRHQDALAVLEETEKKTQVA
ncbi:MAG: glycosyl transferase [Phycisphaerae bacterium]|jgi:cellulose synthase/poly-beta-1,6-N-acetylglucosamine synthase-like glycosyltransferase|nr:MAG: glycosyl transferase [Phycisphaerae bacterium]